MIKKTTAVILTLIMLFSLCVTMYADDNANTGDGTSGYAGSNMGWYSEGQYLWKVTLYVGKTDTVTKQSNLTNDFYLGLRVV